MKVSVIVSCYNYEKYVVECVQSVSAQTYPDIEIIFVDDGSTDRSAQLVESLAICNLRIIKKQNGGQLSAFNAAANEVSGDVIFFIDADDLYEPEYIERVVAFYEKMPDADFVDVYLETFGDEGAKVWDGKDGANKLKSTEDHGFTACKARYLRAWVGAPTSAISMRKSILDKILPLPLESDWRVRADDCLVFGASLVGARKYSYNDASVNYRIHGSNHWYGKEYSDSYYYRREMAIDRLFNTVMAKNHISLSGRLLVKEFATKKARNLRPLIVYMLVAVMFDKGIFWKIGMCFRLARKYRRHKPDDKQHAAASRPVKSR